MTTSKTSRRTRRAGAATILAAGLLIAGCGDDQNDGATGTPALRPSANPPVDQSANHEGDHAADHGEAPRPEVVFTAGDGTLDIPAEVPSGLVDVQLVSQPGEQGHHLLIVRLNDGVELQEFLDAPDDQFLSMVTVVGGNGAVGPGTTLDMTLELPAGPYVAIDLWHGEAGALAEFEAVGPAEVRPEPIAEGTITFGPNMEMDIPADFDGTGVWKFENRDPEQMHEAALMRLADGKTATDLLAFAQGGFQGEDPTSGEFGSVGALGPGQRAWVNLEPGDAGEYALVCWIPGEDGRPHLMNGMIRAVTIDLAG